MYCLSKPIAHEWLLLKRSGITLLLCLVIWISMGLALLLSGIGYLRGRAEQEAAVQLFTRQWNEQQRNPHDAAHFGTYLFRPVTLKGMLDPGLSDYAGTTYRVEAHVQHEMDHSHAESGLVAGRHGPFSIALVLQLVVPFLILITASRSLTTERESGTLSLLKVQAGRMTAFLWGKVWAYYLLFVAILAPFLLLCLFAVWWVLAYLLFYFLVVLIAVLISQLAGSSRGANICAVMVWVLFFVVMPKMAVNQAVVAHPVVSRAVFEDKVRQGYLKGLDGKSPYYERGAQYLKTLKVQGNVEGLLLQFHEDYQEKAYLHYYKDVLAGFKAQQGFLSGVGWIDPYIALKRFSMSLSGTDQSHQADLYLQARSYRSQLIRQLNLELVAHPDGYRADPAFFKGISPFQYRAGKVDWMGIAPIIVWILITAIAVHIIAKRL